MSLSSGPVPHYRSCTGLFWCICLTQLQHQGTGGIFTHHFTANWKAEVIHIYIITLCSSCSRSVCVDKPPLPQQNYPFASLQEICSLGVIVLLLFILQVGEKKGCIRHLNGRKMQLVAALSKAGPRALISVTFGRWSWRYVQRRVQRLTLSACTGRLYIFIPPARLAHSPEDGRITVVFFFPLPPRRVYQESPMWRHVANRGGAHIHML